MEKWIIFTIIVATFVIIALIIYSTNVMLTKMETSINTTINQTYQNTSKTIIVLIDNQTKHNDQNFKNISDKIDNITTNIELGNHSLNVMNVSK